MFNEEVLYHDNHHTSLKGWMAYDNSFTKKRPLVMVIHDWSGRNTFAEEKAKKLAELGYVGFAVDLYGDGRTGKNNEEKTALMKPLIDNRNLLKERLLAALLAGKQLSLVDTRKIAAIGFCFGGLSAIDFARHTNEINGVISFHGLLHAPENTSLQTITAKILVLHGYDDPMAPPQQVMEFANEMTRLKADWQIHMYGHTKHAFTNPQANDPDFGTVYERKADERSWVAMKNFLQEIF